jgi:hypothetical protein
MELHLKTGGTYRIGKNIIKVISIEGNNVSVVLNGTSTYSGWDKTEMEEYLSQELIEQLF